MKKNYIKSSNFSKKKLENDKSWNFSRKSRKYQYLIPQKKRMEVNNKFIKK